MPPRGSPRILRLPIRQRRSSSRTSLPEIVFSTYETCARVSLLACQSASTHLRQNQTWLSNLNVASHIFSISVYRRIDRQKYRPLHSLAFSGRSRKLWFRHLSAGAVATSPRKSPQPAPPPLRQATPATIQPPGIIPSRARSAPLNGMAIARGLGKL